MREQNPEDRRRPRRLGFGHLNRFEQLRVGDEPGEVLLPFWGEPLGNFAQLALSREKPGEGLFRANESCERPVDRIQITFAGRFVVLQPVRSARVFGGRGIFAGDAAKVAVGFIERLDCFGVTAITIIGGREPVQVTVGPPEGRLQCLVHLVEREVAGQK